MGTKLFHSKSFIFPFLAILLSSSFVGYAVLQNSLSGNSTFSVSILPSGPVALSLNQTKVFVANASGTVASLNYVWSIESLSLGDLAINGSDILLLTDGNQAAFRFLTGILDFCWLTVTVNSTSQAHSATVAVQYIGTFNNLASSASYIVACDDADNYQVINGTDGSIIPAFASTSANVTLNDAIAQGGTITIRAGNYTGAQLNVPGNANIVAEPGTIGINYASIDSGAKIDEPTFNDAFGGYSADCFTFVMNQTSLATPATWYLAFKPDGTIYHASTNASYVLNAISATIIAEGGGTLTVTQTPASYIFSAPVLQDVTNLTRPLIIEGKGASFFFQPFESSIASAGIEIGHYSSSVNYVSNQIIIRDLNIDMNGQSQPVDGMYEYAGIRLDRIFNAELDNVQVKNAVWCGVAIYRFSESSCVDYALNTKVNHCEFINCGMNINGFTPDQCYAGVYISNWVQSAVISYSVSRNCFNGFTIEDSSSGSTITGCTAFNCVNTGFISYYSYGVKITENNPVNNTIGIWMYGDARETIAANNFLNTNGIGILSQSDAVIIQGNSIIYSAIGIYQTGNSGTINANLAVNNGYPSGATNCSALVLANSVGNSITGNNFYVDGSLPNYYNSLYGICEVGTSDYNVILGGMVSGNGEGILLTGPNSHADYLYVNGVWVQ